MKKSLDPQLDYKQYKTCTIMNKFLVYTSNLPEMPKDMSDVIAFAKETPKFYISSVELNGCLSEVKAGDQIFTKKGNQLYVIKAIQNGLDNLTEEEQDYIEELKREYGLKNVNITSVAQIVKFETWCKSAKVIINNKNDKKMNNGNSIKGITARIKEIFMPVEAQGIRVSAEGELAVETSNGYVAINSNNELVSFPKELTLDLPVYIVSKPKEQLVVGDVIATNDKSYAKITKIDGSKISATSYTGTGKVIHTIKDFLFNQTMVRVVISMSGIAGGQINPMMLLAMSDEGGSKDSLLPFLMMSQQGSNLGMNPMMAYALMGKDSDNGGSSMKDILMMSMVTGGNAFGGLFGGNKQTAAAPVATKKAKKKKPARKPVSKKNTSTPEVEEEVNETPVTE